MPERISKISMISVEIKDENGGTTSTIRKILENIYSGGDVIEV